MYHRFIAFLFSMCHFAALGQANSSGNFSVTKKNNASLTLVSQYSIGKGSDYFVSKDNFIDQIMLEGRLMHILIGKESKMLTLNLDSKKIGINKLSPLIRSYSKKYGTIKSIYIHDKYYLLTFIRSVICVEKASGKIDVEIPSETNVEYAFIANNIITVFKSADSICNFDINGKYIDAIHSQHSLSGRFYNVGSLVYICDYGRFVIYNSVSKRIDERDFPISRLPYKEPFLADINERHTVWFPYSDRSKILVVNEKNSTVEEIDLRKNFLSKDVSIFESGFPFFNVITSRDNTYYFIAQTDGVMYIYQLASSP